METQDKTATLRDPKEPGDELTPEAREVFDWRREELVEMGYPHHAAVEIAYSNIDLNQLRNLIGQGATVDQAYRILVGTDFLGDEQDDTRLLSPSDKQKRARSGSR